MSEVLIIESIGWIGAILVLYAYFLNSTNKVDSTNGYYQWLNLLGALCLILHTIYNNALPSAFVNVIWTIVAIYSLFRIYKNKTH
ncbi:MAG: hypothetical protein MUE33_01945 [Cytophagaceae bacterium]|jgi:hypothetical protein|nr:hypothetical protein [Cytophagaceae bacterium]